MASGVYEPAGLSRLINRDAPVSGGPGAVDVRPGDDGQGANLPQEPLFSGGSDGVAAVPVPPCPSGHSKGHADFWRDAEEQEIYPPVPGAEVERRGSGVDDGGGLCGRGDGSLGDSVGSVGECLPPIEAAYYPWEPNVPERYREGAGGGDTLPAKDGVRHQLEVLEDQSPRGLARRNAIKAFEVEWEIMNLDPNTIDPKTVPAWKMKLVAAQASQHVVLKGDENHLKQQEINIIPELLKKIAEEKAKLGR